MDKRGLKRVTWTFVTVTVLMVALMLSGNLRRTSHITLPDPGAAVETEPGMGHPGDALTVVEVRPETVQSAIATLVRPTRYRRTVTVDQIWSGGSSSIETAVAVSGGWTRTDRTLPDGRVRHAATDGETTYIWYDDEAVFWKAAAGSITADEEQSIPTYEDILALLPETIAAADYRETSGVNCIYVETEADARGYVLRYWVSVDSGLLAAAEKLLDGETVYRMAALTLDGTVLTAADFTLPDGTVLPDRSPW